MLCFICCCLFKCVLFRNDYLMNLSSPRAHDWRSFFDNSLFRKIWFSKIFEGLHQFNGSSAKNSIKNAKMTEIQLTFIVSRMCLYVWVLFTKARSFEFSVREANVVLLNIFCRKLEIRELRQPCTAINFYREHSLNSPIAFVVEIVEWIVFFVPFDFLYQIGWFVHVLC